MVEPTTEQPLPADAPQSITARSASFTYPGTNTPALNGIDLSIQHGEVIALVGENGSGKTTLARLLTGLFLPTNGSITWDGTETADVDPATVMKAVALVPQDYTRWPPARTSPSASPNPQATPP